MYRWAKTNMRKIFPDHWSFILGEICLYSFVLLVLTGLYLTLFFTPSMTTVVYHGSYGPLQGVRMSEAYQSALHISLDVRGGLLMRQMHHWAALILVAGILTHMMRSFFSGAFRRPREINWLVGFTLLPLAMFEGLTGYDLPDDLLSGTGTRVVQGGILSVPIVGTYLSSFLFGSEFPGTSYVPRFNAIHVLLFPGAMSVMLAAHLALLFFHKHAQYPGPGRTNKNVVGFPLLWVRAAKAGGYFLLVSGTVALVATLGQINPVWAYGPYRPDQVSAGSQPDWYMAFADGLERIMPGWEIRLWGHTLVLGVLIPLVVFGLVLAVIGAYPLFEAWVTGDDGDHHLLDRPRNRPVRTGFGVAWISLYILLFAGAGNDIIATRFRVSVNVVTWVVRIGFFVLPPAAFVAAKRIALGLQRRDRDRVLHGRETGVLKRLPNGGVIEVHALLPHDKLHTLTAHDQPAPLTDPPLSPSWAGSRLPPLLRRLRVRLSRAMYGPHGRVPKPTAREYQEHHPAPQKEKTESPL
ncbi:ubiquinol-cytochrome c reductase cytochrome b subunit [Streptomyces sp. SID4948]|nr:ubiquinol-cytochrome c reductase cytochrome b subunit [Streptomyces sp. SID4948]